MGLTGTFGFHYQDEGILKEFSELSHILIQEKCKNLNYGCKFFEYYGISVVAIETNNSISLFIADKDNKYVPLTPTIIDKK